MRTTFIYALCEPGTRTVRYIGKSDDPNRRFLRHLKNSVKSRTHLGYWLRKLENNRMRPAMEILDEVPLHQWIFWERWYIRQMRESGFSLVNSTDGGEGMSNPSPELLEKMRRPKPARSPEHRRALGAATLGKKRGLTTRLKQSILKQGVKQTPEHIEARASKHRGTKHAGASSQFLGVQWCSSRKKWKATIQVNQRPVHIGRFENESDAAKAADLAILKFHGPLAKTNFPVKRRE